MRAVVWWVYEVKSIRFWVFNMTDIYRLLAKARLFLLSALVAVLCFFALSPQVVAEDEAAEPEEEVQEGEEGAVAAPAIYLPLKPTFVVNYGAAGRLRYLKTDVSVRLSSADTANALRNHMPFVRNNLIMLFASQTNATVGSQDGKEAIRRDALEEIRTILEREERIPRESVLEVFFNNFIVQK